ncbi:MAG: hypothetical protein VX632_08130, partial [Chloroflexota bacterium]|nr:hypothetical protein [Chloroflexota bacterium]
SNDGESTPNGPFDQDGDGENGSADPNVFTVGKEGEEPESDFGLPEFSLVEEDDDETPPDGLDDEEDDDGALNLVESDDRGANGAGENGASPDIGEEDGEGTDEPRAATDGDKDD